MNCNGKISSRNISVCKYGRKATTDMSGFLLHSKCLDWSNGNVSAIPYGTQVQAFLCVNTGG